VHGLEAWWAQGEHAALSLGGIERMIFLRRLGAGPSVTLLHGFPSSSHDWARLTPALAREGNLLLPDLLGFGASEKPAEHAYSLHQQADLVEALWAREGITATRVIAHDLSVSVTQELLARRAEGALAVTIERVDFLNGGLYPDLHRPQPTQTALMDPVRGPQISALIGEELFVAALAPTFSDAYDATADSREIWTATSRDFGQRISHLLIRYIADREEHSERWVGALESTDVRLCFIWGMLDPVSGAHMAERIRERLPRARFAALDDVAHWPALEAPARVLQALRLPA